MTLQYLITRIIALVIHLERQDTLSDDQIELTNQIVQLRADAETAVLLFLMIPAIAMLVWTVIRLSSKSHTRRNEAASDGRRMTRRPRLIRSRQRAQ